MHGAELLKETGRQLTPLIGHEFSVIDEIEPGVKCPLEALSGDHTVGIYLDVIPLKMREHLSGFQEISVADLRPQKSTSDGMERLFLEAESMRLSRFRAEWLQYLETGWEAYVDEVKYPCQEVLGTAHFMKSVYGDAHIYLNTEVPMPLWIRPRAISSKLNGEMPQIVIQGRSLDRIIFTNIHTEVSMEFARRWADAVHGYYKKP